jgi:photosystem II stability/assembly factor-like uncharacterized protein
MKTRLLSVGFLIAFNLICVISYYSQACWEPTNGPYGGICNKLKVINNEVYAATNCGVYSTNDSGITWKNRSAGFLGECRQIQDVDIVNNNMIAGTLDSGIYISQDFGNNWISSNSGINNTFLDMQIRDIFVDGSIVLIGTNNGVYKSINNGVSWTPSNIGINQTGNINALRFVKNGSSIFLGTAYDIYKSNDNGFTWININSSIQAYPFSLVSLNGVLYVLGVDGIYKSTNSGATWSQLTFNFGTPTKLFDAGNNLFCWSNGSTYVSSNGGNSWTLVTNINFSTIVEFNTNFLGGNNGGVYSWINGTQNIKNAGLGGASTTRSLFRDGNNIYSSNANGIYKTLNDGNSWLNISAGLPLNVIVNCITKSGNKLVIGTKGYGIYTSSDNGNTWVQSNSGLTINGIFYSNATALFENNGRLFLGAKQDITFYDFASLFISDDGGSTWVKSSTGLSENCNVSSICNFGSYIVIGTKDEFSPSSFNDGVYLSTDNGTSWFFDGLSGPVSAVCSNTSGYFAGITDVIHSTIDMGNSWTSNDLSGNWNEPINTISYINNTIYAVQNMGVRYLNGNSWPSLGNGCGGGMGLISNFNGTMFIGRKTVVPYNGSYYSIENGVSKYNGNSNEINEKEINNDFSIFPNPTSNSITLKGEKNMNQAFQIVDQMGREVFKGKLTGTETEVNLSALSKGMYTLIIEGNYQPAQIVKE